MSIIKYIKTLFGYPVYSKKKIAEPIVIPDSEISRMVKEWLNRDRSVLPITDQVVLAPVKRNRVPIKSGVPAWFIDPKVVNNIPSVAEQKIMDILNGYKVLWFAEVSFEGFNNANGYPYRYDFYFPELKMIIEYDGSNYHNTEDRIAADNVKTKFCIAHDIKLTRFDKTHYYHLNSHIGKLMKLHLVKLA